MPSSEDAPAPVLMFPFAVDYPVAHVGRAFLIDPEAARLVLDQDRVVASFGPWRLETTLDNIESVHVTGPYSAAKVIGPPRLSLKDRGLTFATTTERGLCLRFHEPVRGIEPLGLLRHPGLTVTVQDPDHVAEVLERARTVQRRAPDAEVGEWLAETARDALQGETASQLRAQAAQRGIEHASSASKAELVEELAQADDDPATREERARRK
jgi:hypothetical protein